GGDGDESVARRQFLYVPGEQAENVVGVVNEELVCCRRGRGGEVELGAMRELNWHPQASEAQGCIAGKPRTTVFAPADRAGTFDYLPGDVGFVPQNMGHYIEDTGKATLWLLQLWRADRGSACGPIMSRSI